MLLKFLGTGPSEAIPRKGHRDALCSDARQGGRSKRFRSSALISDKNTNILIDCGPDIRQQLNIKTINKIDAILITHSHEDAIGGLKIFNQTVNKKTDVYTDIRTINEMTAKYGILQNLNFIKIVNNKTIIINKIHITPLLVLHSRQKFIKTHGFKFPNFFYASDFYELPSSTKKAVMNTKTLILDGAMYMGIKMPSHSSADTSIRLAANLKTQKLYLTQSGHTYPPHDDAQKALTKYKKSLNKKWPKNVQLAYDGLIIKF